MDKTYIELNAEWAALMKQYDASPLEDATEPFVVVVDEEVQKAGKPNEPGLCTFVRGATSGGAVAAMFGNKVANIIFRDKKTKKCSSRRFILPRDVQLGIELKDNGGEVPAGMYVFMPPLGQRTLAAQKQRAKTKKQSKIKQKTDQQKRNSEKQKQAASKTSEVKRKATAALAAATQAYKERKPNLPAPKRITLRLRNFTGNNGYMEA